MRSAPITAQEAFEHTSSASDRLVRAYRSYREASGPTRYRGALPLILRRLVHPCVRQCLGASLRTRVSCLVVGDEAKTSSEYATVLAVVVIGLVVSVSTLGGNVRKQFGGVGTSIAQGAGEASGGDRPAEGGGGTKGGSKGGGRGQGASHGGGGGDHGGGHAGGSGSHGGGSPSQGGGAGGHGGGGKKGEKAG